MDVINREKKVTTIVRTTVTRNALHSALSPNTVFQLSAVGSAGHIMEKPLRIASLLLNELITA